MRYLPHTSEEIGAMLAAIGVDSLDRLFDSVPAECRMTNPWNLPAAQSEWELNDHLRQLAGAMRVDDTSQLLVGAGSYRHHIPETVRSLAGRSEFLTAYTPYQPEMAQGTLQGIFEYQTLTARLLGVDVVNASMYDGGSALAEALLMGLRIGWPCPRRFIPTIAPWSGPISSPPASRSWSWTIRQMAAPI